MKIIVDEWGEKVRPNETLQALDGSWKTVTDLCPDAEQWQIGAVPEGGCEDDDGDYHPAWYFRCRVEEMQ